MTFTDVQQKTLRTAMDRIIPADDYPGAWDAGAGNYITRQLNGDLRHLAEIYQQGLDMLCAESISVFRMEFSELEPSKQDELLSKIEKGNVTQVWPISPREFFAMLVQHCVEGYYSDPGNGGNKDARSWEMIGFDSVQPDKSVEIYRGRFRT